MERSGCSAWAKRVLVLASAKTARRVRWITDLEAVDLDIDGSPSIKLGFIGLVLHGTWSTA
jgi:hypothetical protein